jgi:hypothetical protein
MRTTRKEKTKKKRSRHNDRPFTTGPKPPSNTTPEKFPKSDAPASSPAQSKIVGFHIGGNPNFPSNVFNKDDIQVQSMKGFHPDHRDLLL